MLLPNEHPVTRGTLIAIVLESQQNTDPVSWPPRDPPADVLLTPFLTPVQLTTLLAPFTGPQYPPY